jgi:Tol biopolymer transport system component
MRSRPVHRRVVRFAAAASVALAVCLAAACSGGSSGSTPTGPAKTSAIAVAGGGKLDALTAVSPDGTSVELVPGNGGMIFDPAWSTDGSWIAYIRNVGGQKSDAPGLFLYDVAGKRSTQVLTSAGTPAQVLDFAWISPTQLVLANHIGEPAPQANGDLSICDSTKQELTPLNGADGAQMQGVSLSATPDGKTLAVTQYGEPADHVVTESLLLVDMATKGVTTVAKRDVSTRHRVDAFGRPVVSPDGTLIFSQMDVGDRGFVYTIHGADGSQQWTSEPITYPARAAWSPTGDRVVFGGGTATAGGSMAGSVLVWDTQTEQATQLARLKGWQYAEEFAWSPDGTQIAAAVYEMSLMASSARLGMGDFFSLWVMDADGKHARKLVPAVRMPSWAMSSIDRSTGAVPSTAGSPSP